MGAAAAEEEFQGHSPAPPADPHQQISRWQAPVGTVILRRLGTGVGEGGGVLLKEVPGVSHLVSVGPVQAQIRHSMNHE